MDPLDLFDDVVTKTGDLIAGVRDDQWGLPTPCEQYDVRALTDHMVGWARAFEAGRYDRDTDEDPTTYHAADPEAEFRAAGTSLAAEWRAKGLDAPARGRGGERPGEVVFNITVTEFLTHGWDLAVATGQRIPFSDAEASEVLDRIRATLPPQFRGEGMPFAEPISIDDDAPAVERLAAFLGRQPS